MLTYVRSLCSSVTTESELSEWKWSCRFGCRYLCCCWYLSIEYGVTEKKQKNEKKKSAHLQFSSLILLLHEGGIYWVRVGYIVVFTGVSGKVCCYNLLHSKMGCQFQQFPEISEHCEVHSALKVFHFKVGQLCFCRRCITLWMCSLPRVDRQISDERCSQPFHTYCPNIVEVKNYYYCWALHVIPKRGTSSLSSIWWRIYYKYCRLCGD